MGKIALNDHTLLSNGPSRCVATKVFRMYYYSDCEISCCECAASSSRAISRAADERESLPPAGGGSLPRLPGAGLVLQRLQVCLASPYTRPLDD